MKNPGKRSSVKRLLEHPFLQENLTTQIAKDLLDRLYNEAMNNTISEDRDNDKDDRNIFRAPHTITSIRDTKAVSSSSKKKKPITKHSPLNVPLSTKNKNNENVEHIQRLQSLGLAEENIHTLMKKLSLSAFENLSLNEIQHIVDVICNI
ncbi:unnamed protein product [Rotaria sordida]|uniref:Uncharacterized protein n=1 Tax=Rotaria sordida TaxID=392033 RepID=A0A816FC20_9BILA|nr:unnamed protein product [Rotaria sordida]CAF1658560.1 unnamed protein product [Rotaria sordida]